MNVYVDTVGKLVDITSIWRQREDKKSSDGKKERDLWVSIINENEDP